MNLISFLTKLISQLLRLPLVTFERGQNVLHIRAQLAKKGEYGSLVVQIVPIHFLPTFL